MIPQSWEARRHDGQLRQARQQQARQRRGIVARFVAWFVDDDPNPLSRLDRMDGLR